MDEVVALHAVTDELATEVSDLVQARAPSRQVGACSLAVALGKLCFELDLDPQQMKDCIDIAYRTRRETQEA